MVSVDKAVLARYSFEGHHFEVLVDPDKALAFREGKATIEGVLAIGDVFKDASKGDRASPELMRKAFGTDDPLEAAKRIVLKGDVQLTTDQRRRLVEERRKQLIAMISRLAINPQSGLPHPPQRIELALGQVRFHPDPFKPADIQMEAAVKLLRPLLPLKFEMRKIAVRVPAEFTAKVYKIVHSHTIKKEEWQKDGSLIVLVEIPAGIQNEFFDELNSASKGQIETRRVND